MVEAFSRIAAVDSATRVGATSRPRISGSVMTWTSLAWRSASGQKLRCL
jgi:hypothetical protein